MHPELGFSPLAGAPDSPRELITEMADAVIMHGAGPTELEPVIAAYRDG